MKTHSKSDNKALVVIKMVPTTEGQMLKMVSLYGGKNIEVGTVYIDDTQLNDMTYLGKLKDQVKEYGSVADSLINWIDSKIMDWAMNAVVDAKELMEQPTNLDAIQQMTQKVVDKYIIQGPPDHSDVLYVTSAALGNAPPVEAPDLDDSYWEEDDDDYVDYDDYEGDYDDYDDYDEDDF